LSTNNDIDDNDIDFPNDDIDNSHAAAADDNDDETYYEDAVERRSILKVKMGTTIAAAVTTSSSNNRSVNFLDQSNYFTTYCNSNKTGHPGHSEMFQSARSGSHLDNKHDQVMLSLLLLLSLSSSSLVKN
jgi:hypothetical protein